LAYLWRLGLRYDADLSPQEAKRATSMLISANSYLFLSEKICMMYLSLIFLIRRLEKKTNIPELKNFIFHKK
jgi:hypothetical protein